MIRSAFVAAAALVCGCSATATSDPVPPTSLVDATTSTTVAAPTSTTVAPSLDTAAGLAAELSVIEAGLRDPSASATDLEAYGRRQQLAYRAVNRNEAWHDDLVDLVAPVARGPLGFHLLAWQAWHDHAAGAPASDPPDDLPAWTIIEPLPAEELLGYYREAEELTGVPWEYLAAINFQETRMGRIAGVSSAGAVGPMQFLPSTWAECCEGDPTVPRDAIIGAARYLVRRGGPADMQAALYGYNPNSGYVGAVTAYAMNMMADPRAFYGYHAWQVFVGSSAGTVRLPVGYSRTEPIAAAAYLAEHPEDSVP